MKLAVVTSLFILLAWPAEAEFSVVPNDAAVETDTPRKPTPKSEAPHKHASARQHPSPLAVATKKTATTNLADGFGDQIPLAFAIRQMAPDGYEILFEPPADPEALVSWRGGKPWMQTLADIVSPLGLTVSARPQSKTIVIGPATAEGDH